MTDKKDQLVALAEAYDNIIRNRTIEEVAQNLEQNFKFPFGTDTVASFATYIRSMKHVRERNA
mgnify:CR=1 FL=1